MSQRSGELRDRVTIQLKETTYDENNHPTETWAEFKKLWSKLSYSSAKDLVTAQAAGSQVVARLKLRWRDDITTEMRVLHRGQTFAITSPPMPDNEDGLTYMTLMLAHVE